MAFQFQLSQKHLEYQKKVTDLLEASVSQDDSEVLKSLANNGYVSLPGCDSGAADDYLSLVLTVEEIAKLRPKVANKVVELLFAQEVVKRHASPEHQVSCVDKIRKLEMPINVLFSEPGNYDINKLATTIEKQGDLYKVKGTKIFAAENAGAQKYLTVGRLVDGDKKAFAIVGLDADQVKLVEKEVAYANSNIKIEMAEIDTEVQAERVMTDVKDSLRAALSVWKILIAASAIGLAHTNLISSLNLVKTTKNSDKQALTTSQAVQFTLSDMFGEVEGARLVTYYSSALVDAGTPSVRFSSIAKVQATEAAVLLSNQASGLFGSVGNVYDSSYLEALQLAYNRQIKDGATINSYNVIYEEALAKR